MDMQGLVGVADDPLAIPIDRLYRISPDVYRGMVERGLLTDQDKVVFRDGLLVQESAGGSEADPLDGLYRFPLDVYHEMAGLGLLTKYDKAVLLDGLLVKKMTKGEPHVVATLLVVDALRGLAGAGWHVRPESPLTLPSGPSGHGSEPEPDVYVVRGATRDYLALARHPGPGDLAFVVEVSDSSLRDDRRGLARYAWSRIPVAWVVNLTNETVEVYTRPTGPADPARYEETKFYQKGDRLPVVVDGLEVGQVAVADLLP